MIKTIGIIGDGRMGHSIFRHLYNYNYNLIWVNLTTYREESEKLSRKLNRFLSKNIISQEEYNTKINSITITNSLETINQCDLIIETVNEDIHIKNSLFDDLDIKANPGAIIVSNSSSILPGKFTVSEKIKPNFCGFHFFYPVETNKLLEIIPTSETTKEVIESLLDFAEKISKTSFLQKGKDAFAINRFFLEIQSELFNYCTNRKIPYNKADQAIKKTLFPIGIFETMDIIGFRILEYSISNYINLHDNPQQIHPLLSFIKDKMKDDKMGLISKEGFLTYPLENLSVTDKEIAEMSNFVKIILAKTADNYINNGFFKNKEEVEIVISEYTSSDFRF